MNATVPNVGSSNVLVNCGVENVTANMGFAKTVKATFMISIVHLPARGRNVKFGRRLILNEEETVFHRLRSVWLSRLPSPSWPSFL